MSKKYDESELYREKILENGISEKELQKLVKEKKSDLKKNLGKHGKIDDKSALFLIAKERGIVLISSSTIVLEDKSDFERYLDYRDSTRETCLYLINTLEPKIDDLIKQVEKIEVAEKLVIATKNSNQTMIDFLNNKEYDELGIEYLDRSIASTEFIHHDLLMVKKYIDSLLIPSLFKNDEDWIRPKDFDSLYNIDLGLFDDVPKIFKEIMDTVYLAFLRTGHRKHVIHLPTSSGFFPMHKTFENENSYLRYANGRASPYNSPTSRSEDWVRDHSAPNEFLQFFSGTVGLIDSFRNFEAHKRNASFKDAFDQAGRVIKDPLTGMLSPGNFIILANNSINLIYEFMEIIQIWIDSKKIEKKFS